MRYTNLTTRLVLSRSALMLLAVTVAAVPNATVFADNYDDQINQLQSEADSLSGPLASISAQANTLQEAVNRLNAQISDLQGRIVQNQQKRVELERSIAKAEKDIAARSSALSDTMKTMYVDGDVSNLEKVASSKSISEFVDKQEYRNKIRDKVQRAMKEIRDLKEKLETQKKQVDQLIRDDERMRVELGKQQAAQAKLLAETRGQEAEYQKQIAGKKSQMDGLRAAQIAANQRLSSGGGGSATAGDPGKGGYPSRLANAPLDALVDPWGMYNRECVSYTAWKVQQKTGRMPYWGGRGNANQWPSSARADGIATGSTPKAGSVAILMAGQYGHAMWVESVNGNGTINVSQYNYDWNGNYSEMTISGSGLTYIYF